MVINISNEIQKRYLPTNYVVFKCLFGNAGNERITTKFLEYVVGEKIEKVSTDFKLDLIRENQYMIYSAVQEINTRLADLEISNKQLLQIIHSANQNVSQMRTELDRLQKTSQLTAYYAQRAQVELEYMNRMNFYAKKYDNAGFFLQRPPV